MKYFIFLDSSSQHLLLGVAGIDQDQLTCWQWGHDLDLVVQLNQNLTNLPKSSTNPADHILPILKQLFDTIHISIDDIAFVAYGTGPGAFTGVRTSCAIAQGLCFAKSIPAVAVDSLQIVAQSFMMKRDEIQSMDKIGWFEKTVFSLAAIASMKPPVDSVIAAIDARMQEVYWQVLSFERGAWQVEEPIQVGRVDTMIAPQHHDFMMVGNAHEVYATDLSELMAKAKAVQTVVPQGYAMASLAAMAYQRGQTQTASQIEPLYVRDQVALTIAQRQAQGISS